MILRSTLKTCVAAVALAAAAPAMADEIKLGVLLGFTGPLESLAPPIAAGAELAMTHVNEQGGIGDGDTLVSVRGDSTCADATAAANAADRLINTNGVLAIVGAMCSGATISAANVSGIPTNTVMISPSATSPALTTLADEGLVFRTAPSDAYQGDVLARLLIAKGLDNIAITYVNNDYGKGLADSLEAAMQAAGGTVTAKEQHEEGKSDYRAELGSLAASGSTTLVVIAYAQGSGQTILRQAVEAGDFLNYVGADGMISDDIFTGIAAGAVGNMVGTKPGTPDIPGAEIYSRLATAANLDPTAIFAPQAYDAAFLLALAIQKNGANREGLADAVTAVATAPGVVILPGEWEKAKNILANGGEINYEGATGPLDFDAVGDIAGYFLEMAVENGAWREVRRIE